MPLLALAAILPLASASASRAIAVDAAPDAAPPNIVLFLVDDLGQQDASVPMFAEASPLNRRYRTPNLERLAARGVRFSNAYAAAPVCTPSRTAILTGQSPARTHITYWTLHKDTDNSSRHPTLEAPKWAVNGAQPAPTNLPEVLRAAGYRTIHAGKAHWGARGTPGADPLAMGFDVNIAGHAAGAPGSFLGTDHFKDNGRKQRGKVAPADAEPSVWDVPGLEKWHGDDIWLDDAIARDACDAISAAVADGKPFYLSLATYGVHAPIMRDARFVGDYADLDPTEAAYASMVAAYDEALGQVVARCEALGVLDRTVIVFTGDNGGLSAHARGAAPDGKKAHTHNAPLRSGKGSAYEGGVRVPFVVAGPGVAPRAAPVDAPIVGTDLYPTILALAGLAPPEGHALDGVDLTGLLAGGAAPAERTIVFTQPHKWGPTGPGIEPFTAIRRGDWKLLFFHDPARAGARYELYDVAQDPGETLDLASREPARLAAMVAELRAEIARTGLQLSIDKATGAPVTLPEPAAGDAPSSAVPNAS